MPIEVSGDYLFRFRFKCGAAEMGGLFNRWLKEQGEWETGLPLLTGWWTGLGRQECLQGGSSICKWFWDKRSRLRYWFCIRRVHICGGYCFLSLHQSSRWEGVLWLGGSNSGFCKGLRWVIQEFASWAYSAGWWHLLCWTFSSFWMLLCVWGFQATAL